MIRKISGWIYRISNRWVALATLGGFLLFTGLVLPTQADQAEVATGSTESPDTSFFYSPDDLYRIAEAYGESGRRAYVRARFTFDLVWPLVYTGFLVTAISWLHRQVMAGEHWTRYANLVPILGALFDYLENLSTSLVMIRYPSRTPVFAILAPGFTAVKWVFVGGSFLLLGLMGLARSFTRFRRER